jgi:hypothetical protein
VLESILNYLNKNPASVPIVAAAIALFGVVVSAFVAFTVSKRSTYVTAVTAERSKWIDKLRGNIADLLGICGAIHLTSSDKTSEKALGKRQDADRLVGLITLQLNPNDKSGIDQNLIKLLPQLVEASEKNDGSYRTFEACFVRHAQFLLKEEWEKVKSEAKGWMLALLTGAGCKSRKRARGYAEFCGEEKSSSYKG